MQTGLAHVKNVWTEHSFIRERWIVRGHFIGFRGYKDHSFGHCVTVERVDRKWNWKSGKKVGQNGAIAEEVNHTSAAVPLPRHTSCEGGGLLVNERLSIHVRARINKNPKDRWVSVDESQLQSCLPATPSIDYRACQLSDMWGILSINRDYCHSWTVATQPGSLAQRLEDLGRSPGTRLLKWECDWHPLEKVKKQLAPRGRLPASVCIREAAAALWAPSTGTVITERWWVTLLKRAVTCAGGTAAEGGGAGRQWTNTGDISISCL